MNILPTIIGHILLAIGGFVAALVGMLTAHLVVVVAQHTSPATSIVATATPATSSNNTNTAPTAKPIPSPAPSIQPTPTATTPQPAATLADTVVTKPIGEVNSDTRAALVNILCLTKSGGYLNPLSGSGVIIDSRGVVLTNAHVAQYFLLRDFPTPDNVDCVVRTGSPATAAYHAKLLYLPPAWVDANAKQINAQQAMGTGENDYGFLLLTSRADNSPLPATIDSILVATDAPTHGEQVLLAAYPAGFLEGQAILNDLYAATAVTTIGDIFTFSSDTTHADLVSAGGTIVTQAGSSGGALVRASDGALQGIITTDTAGTTTASRDLHAITLGHIDRSLAAFGEGGILQLLVGNINQKADDFNANVAPSLAQKLEAVFTH